MDACPACGRVECRCGHGDPKGRRCKTHAGRTLIIECVPSYGHLEKCTECKGSGNAPNGKDPCYWCGGARIRRTILKWTEYVRCPVRNCPTLPRTIKAPTGRRKDNRKTC